MASHLLSGTRLHIAPAALVCVLAALSPAIAARPNQPSAQIALEPLGVLPFPPALLTSGKTLFTLNFVDASHLLLTFHTHGLMPRLPDALPEDEDRYVEAVMLEQPSGRVLARTRWRTRDHDRYLWPLGNGRFLLRNRSRLALIEPLRNLASGDAFHEELFAQMPRRIGLVDVAPDGDLITVETLPPRKPKLTGAAASAAALAATEPGHEAHAENEPRPEYTLHFYRLVAEKPSPNAVKNLAPGERLLVQSAGSLVVSTLVRVAMTAEGYLTSERESGGVYNFDFHTHTGRKLELSPYETSCAPHAFFTGPTDFVAFGCRGAADRLELSGFNLRGEEPWVDVLAGDQLSASILAAPAAGRFAFERMLAPGSAPPGSMQPPGSPSQEVTVFQHADGRTLLKMQPVPAQLAGQNFDLSPDGTLFASVQAGFIQLYPLPEMTSKDRKALALSLSVQTEKTLAAVRLPGGQSSDAAAETPIAPPDAAEVAPPTAPAEALAPAAQKAAEGVVHTIENGDVAPAADGHRPPPTLYDPAHPKEPK